MTIGDIYIDKILKDEAILKVIANYLGIKENDVTLINMEKEDDILSIKGTLITVLVIVMNGDFPCRLDVYGKNIPQYENTDIKLAKFIATELKVNCLAPNLDSQLADFFKFDEHGHSELVFIDEDMFDEEDKVCLIKNR